METNQNPLFREKGITVDYMLPQLQRRAKSVIEQQVRLRTTFYDRNDVPIFRGQARFVDEHTVEVVKDDGGRDVLQGEHIVIATGVAARQAREAGHDEETEHRVLALHGLLHLAGYDHEADAGEMARVEARLRRRGGLTAGLIERGGRG